MNTTTASHLSLDSMSEAFRASFDDPEAYIELIYIREDRVKQAELHPTQVRDLRDRVRFAVVASDADEFQVWANDTRSGLSCQGDGLGLSDAKTMMDRMAEAWPDRTDIMDEDQLRNYIIEHHTNSFPFFESLDVLIHALHVEEHERDMYYSCSLRAVLQTQSGWAVWATDDLHSDVALVGLYETEAIARKAAAKACKRDALEYLKWLREQARMEWGAASEAGDHALAEEYYTAMTHLGWAIPLAEDLPF